ncbi:MAG TPA: hypothetical protein VFZ23_12135, partial [Pyrinomonadaceae bacterium]
MKLKKLLSAVLVLFVLAIPSLSQGRTGSGRVRANSDLIIAGGTVVTMDKDRRVIENGAVAIRGDKIIAVGARATLARRYPAAQTIIATGKVIIPGLINTHTHVPMSLFRGIADDLDLN